MDARRHTTLQKAVKFGFGGREWTPVDETKRTPQPQVAGSIPVPPALISRLTKRYDGIFKWVDCSKDCCSRQNRLVCESVLVMQQPVIETSVVRCPRCGTEREETIPLNACRAVYTCPECHATVRPLPGDCCVFCSYGTMRCPPEQTQSHG
jgi:hypothetical protein